MVPVVVVFEKHSTVHKADDILQPFFFFFLFLKTPKSRRRGRSGWSKADTGSVVDTTPFTAFEMQGNHKTQTLLVRRRGWREGRRRRRVIIQKLNHQPYLLSVDSQVFHRPDSRAWLHVSVDICNCTQ